MKKISTTKSPRLLQLEKERKEIDDEIAEINAAESIKITKADRKRLEQLHEDYIASTMVSVKCHVTVLIDDDGTINDYTEESVSQCVSDDQVKKSDVKALKRAKKKFYDELERLTKKYNTTSNLLEGYYC